MTLNKESKIDGKITKSVNKKGIFSNYAFLSVFTISVSFLATIGITLGLILPLKAQNSNKHKYEILYVDSIFEVPFFGHIKQWDEKTTIEKYTSFTYESIVYSIAETHYGNPVSESFIDYQLGDIIGHGYDEIEKTIKEINGKAYKIKGVDIEASLIVQFSDDENYYAYFNSGVSFDTIQEIYDKLTIKETLSFNHSYYYLYANSEETHYIRFDDFDDKYIYEMLLDDVNLEDLAKDLNSNHVYSIYKKPYINIEYSSEKLGNSNSFLGIALNEDGYLIFTFAWARHVYNAGKEKIKEFENYLFNNIHAYELVVKAYVIPD